MINVAKTEQVIQGDEGWKKAREGFVEEAILFLFKSLF